MIVVDRASGAIAAGASATPFLGRPINFAPFNGYLEVGVGGAAGLTYDVTVDSKAIATGVPCQVLTTFPILPGELDFDNERVWANANIIVRINNPTAGVITHFSYIRLSDMPRN